MSEQCQGEEMKLLQFIKGIANYSAATIMIEIEDISRFPSPKHLASYFGLHTVIKQSDDKVAYRMSKKGRPSMRTILYMCANNGVLYDEHLKKIYHHHRKNGMSHNQALAVIMYKNYCV